MSVIHPEEPSHPHVLIVGGGFAGLEAAKRLAHSKVRVTLVDRHNHHLFQPLLYQVASAILSPADIAAPIRQVLRKQMNTEVLLGDPNGLQGQILVPQIADRGREKLDAMGSMVGLLSLNQQFD